MVRHYANLVDAIPELCGWYIGLDGNTIDAEQIKAYGRQLGIAGPFPTKEDADKYLDGLEASLDRKKAEATAVKEYRRKWGRRKMSRT